MTVQELRKALQKAEVNGYINVPVKIFYDKHYFTSNSCDIDSVIVDFAYDGKPTNIVWLELA